MMQVNTLCLVVVGPLNPGSSVSVPTGAQGLDRPDWPEFSSLLVPLFFLVELLRLWLISEGGRLQDSPVQLLQGGAAVSDRRLQGFVLL